MKSAFANFGNFTLTEVGMHVQSTDRY